MIDTVLYHEGGGEHDITGPFLKNSGVCDGIAKAVKSICDYVAFPCVVIEGEAQRADGKIGRHAWNAIKIDGKWNYYDFTFDITLNQNNPCKSIKCVDYFGLDYRRMSNDHFSWSTKLDTDNQHADYFAKFKLVIACQGELENMVFRGMEEGNPDFAFRIAEHWREFAIGDSLEKLIDLAVKSITEVIGIHISLMRNKGRDMSILHKCCCGGEEIPMSLTPEIVYGGLVESNSPPQDGIHDCLQISGKFNGQKAKFGIK